MDIRTASFVAAPFSALISSIAVSEKSAPMFKVCVISGCTSASKIASFDGKCLYRAPAVIPVVAAMERIDAFSKLFCKNSFFAFARIFV